ncbi:MAG: PD-(D/E)XK nuclease family protein [Gemmatimonadota bacterium]|nr:MAG: PD-(D/E)XK nuclease family protein [Gemmatimonadota bacterium]
MSALQVVICADPQRLLEAAADGFLTPLTATAGNPFPSPSYLLALRQGGLRDDLIRLAAERQVAGWFDPPLCVFHELPEWLGGTDRRPLGDYERLVLITAVLREAAGEVFGRMRDPGAFSDAVDRLFGELVQEGVTAAQFLQAAAQREGDRFEVARDRELAIVYRAYLDRLTASGRRDGRDTLVDCARALRADPGRLTRRLRGRQELRVLGLHDLRGGWRPLLAALTDSPALDRVVLYSADDSLLHEGLEAQVERLDYAPVFGAALFETAEPDAAAIDLVAAPDADREVEEVARRVRALAEQGAPLHRIAVVSRKARPHLDLAVAALVRAGVPAAARLRISFAEIPVVRSVLGLFRAAADCWSRRALVDLTAQPYYANELDITVLNHIGYRAAVAGLDAWRGGLMQLEREAERAESADEDDEGRRRHDVPRCYRVRRTRHAFERLADLLRPLDEARRLTDWVHWLLGFLERDPLGIETQVHRVPSHRYDIARNDMVGWTALHDVVAEWAAALDTWGDRSALLSAAQFHERLQRVLSGDVALWTPTRRGVQVLESLAAVYRPVDHLFVLGMEAGRFPSPHPRSPLIDDADRTALRALGVPLEGASLWDQRERSLFRILLAGASRSVTLSYVALDELGELQAPSTFVESVAECHVVNREEIPPSRVLTPEVPVYANHAALENALHTAGVERVRETGGLTAYSGLVEDPALLARLARQFGEDYVWSPSQLEQYATCPWGWYAAQLLRLEKVEDPEQEMDPATRGGVLHDALKRFFDGARKRKGDAVFLTKDDLAWIAADAAAALDAAIEHASDQRWMGHVSLLPAKREELRRILMGYLTWEIELHDKMTRSHRGMAPKMVRTAVAQHEQRFDNAVLERGGLVIRYRGFIDRVEVGCDGRVPAQHLFAAVDYKTSEFSTPGEGKAAAWDDGVVLQVPLYAHALRTLVEGADVAWVEYRALKKKDNKAVHRLQLYEVDWKGPLLVPMNDAKAKLERALDRVPELVRSVRNGRFPAAVPPSCGCPSWCHGSDICRSLRQPQGRRA